MTNCVFIRNTRIVLEKIINSLIDKDNLRYDDIHEELNSFLSMHYIIKSSLCFKCKYCFDYYAFTNLLSKFLNNINNLYEKNKDFIIKHLIEKPTDENEISDKIFILLDIYNFNLDEEFKSINDEINKIFNILKYDYLNYKKAIYSDDTLRIYEKLSQRPNLPKKHKFEADKHKIIYFDTNIVAEFIQGNIKNEVDLLKSKHYLFPYSPFIIEDKIKSNKLYLKDEIRLIEELSEKFEILYDDNFNLIIVKENVSNCYKRVKLFLPETSTAEDFYYLNFEQSKFVLPNHLKRKIESSKDLNFLSNCNKEEDSFLKYIINFYKFNFSLDELKSNSIFTKSIYEKLKIVDQLNKFFNIISFQCDNEEQKIKSNMQDLEHIKVATYANYFVTNDKKLLNSAKVIFKFLDIKTEVLNLEDFKKLANKISGVQNVN